ncbi:MAG: type III-B CRISPR module RAMP protein Cmr1 [Dethiobacteria bacterium]
MYWDATYRVTTPLFMGGAEPNVNVELRPPTLKGLLRFWFRAVALPKLKKPGAVKNLEEDIFGSTKKQSSFLLGLHEQNDLPVMNTGENWRNCHGLLYLGRGVVQEKRIPGGRKTEIQVRPYFKPGGSFTVRIQAKKDAPEDLAFFLPLSLQALGLFGAAGARSRKGFGSLSLESLIYNNEETWEKPATVEKLKEQQKELLQKINLDKADVSLPEYTAFSGQSRVWIANTGSDACRLLNDIGYEILRYRSYGRKDQGNHILPDQSAAEQVFADDHDLILDFCKGKQINTHPRRVVFGLPHNYFFISTRDKVDIAPANKDYNRRASPLFIHIHALGKNNYAAVLTLLPATFLPVNEKIRITASNRRSGMFNTVEVACNEDYCNITDFMDRPAFSQGKVVVWP